MSRIGVVVALFLGLLVLGHAGVCQPISAVFSTQGGYIQPGWNLISLPASPDDPDPASVLRETALPNNSLQYWSNGNGGGYRLYGIDWFGPMEPGGCYWVNEPPPAKDIGFAGTENLCDWTITFPAHARAYNWVMFGHPFNYPTPCSQVRFSTPSHPEPMDWLTASFEGVVESTAACYYTPTHSLQIVGPGGQDRTDLEPWRGYWLLVDTSEPVTMTVPAVVPRMEWVRFSDGAPLYDPTSQQTFGVPTAPPQWDLAGSHEPAAYVRGASASIQGQVRAEGPAGCAARIRSVECVLQDESAPQWPAQVEPASPATTTSLQTPALPAKLAKHTLALRWNTEITYDGRNWYPVQTPVVTEHTVYTLLSAPKSPMDYDPTPGSKHVGAWIPLVEGACQWSGAPQPDGSRAPVDDPTTALKNICLQVNHGDFHVKVPHTDPLIEYEARGLFHYSGVWATNFAEQDFGVFPPYAGGSPLFDEGDETVPLSFSEGDGNALVTSGADDGPAFSGSKFYRVTGAEVSNPSAWDYSLTEFPFLTWAWKKDGGNCCEIRFRLRNDATGESRWIRYWEGSEASPCADPSIRVEIHPEIPGDWEMMFRNVREDAAKLLGWRGDQLRLVGIALRPWDGEAACYDAIALGAASNRLHYNLAGYLAMSAMDAMWTADGKPGYLHFQLRGECDDIAHFVLCMGSSVGMNLRISQICSASGSGFWQQDVCPIGWDSCVELGLGEIFHPGWNHGTWVTDSLWPMPWGTFYRSLWHQAVFSLDDNSVYDPCFSMRDPLNPNAKRYPLGLPLLGGTPGDYEGWLNRPDYTPPPGIERPDPAWFFEYSLSSLVLD